MFYSSGKGDAEKNLDGASGHCKFYLSDSTAVIRETNPRQRKFCSSVNSAERHCSVYVHVALDGSHLAHVNCTLFAPLS